MTEPEAPPVPAVIASIPAKLGPVDVLVQHTAWGSVEVSVRPLGSRMAWAPLTHLGGTFEVRP